MLRPPRQGRRYWHPTRHAVSALLLPLLILPLLLPAIATRTTLANGTATLQLSATTVSCRSMIVATGSGFTPGSTVTFVPGDAIPEHPYGPVIAETTVAADGTVSAAFQLGAFAFPCSGQPYGRDGTPIPVTAVTTTSGVVYSEPAATASAVVVQADDDPTLLLSPNHGTGCFDVTAQGSNFEPNTNVSFFAGPGHNPQPLGETTTTADGRFTHTFDRDMLPFLDCDGSGSTTPPGGETIVIASTGTSLREGDPLRFPFDAAVFINSDEPVDPNAPTLRVTPSPFVCGSGSGVVNIVGTNFLPDSDVTLSVAHGADSGGVLDRVTTDEHGAFSRLVTTGDLHPECRGAEPIGGVQTLRIGADTGDGPPFGPPSAVTEVEFFSGVSAAFAATWQRTDQPVADGTLQRTWMWGESGVAFSDEPYAEGHDGRRFVYYYDKARMEVTDPTLPLDDPWFVTNGLLVVELVTGQMQVGDTAFEPFANGAADIPIVGDPDGAALTYRAIAEAGLRDTPALEPGTTIAWQIDADGALVATDDPTLVEYGVTAAERVTLPGIDHTVASVFRDFMQSSGPIQVDGELTQGPLFANPFYATGLPITEAYWTRTTVGGVERDVLLQCFERRCLSYTPGNPAGWEVEAGNVGQHSFRWRYGAGE